MGDPPKSQIPCYVWECVWNAGEYTEDDIKSSLKGITKKFVFQLEAGSNTGHRHYQGRISLIKKKRKNELFKLFEGKIMPNWIEPTVSTEHQKEAFYCMKEDTRIAGPWTDQDEEKYIPRQYRGFMDRLLPFQQTIWDSANVFNSREINVVYCKKGNNGKSTIASLCELNGNGLDMPPINDAEKLIYTCCNICMAKDCRNPSPIFFDLPRAMTKDKLYGIYSAIEQIKKGKLYDLRYKYTEWWIDSPAIWVFSNDEPNQTLMSKDRWKIWEINEKSELVKYDSDDD